MEKPQQQVTILAGGDAWSLYCACYVGCTLAAKSMWGILGSGEEGCRGR